MKTFFSRLQMARKCFASGITKEIFRVCPSGFAMVKNARRRFTCENASKRINFVVPGVALPTPWMQKIVQNRRKFTIE